MSITMEFGNHINHFLVTPLVISPLVVGFVWMITSLKRYLHNRTIRSNNLLTRTFSSLPVVPGLPLLGNLRQLKNRKIHQILANWAEIYGPIYSIKLGAVTIVILNSTDVVKEALVAKFSSISNGKLTNAMQTLATDITFTSATNEYHKMARRYIVSSVLGASAQRRFRAHRDTMMDNIVRRLQAHAKENPLKPVNFRNIFQTEIFSLTLKQALGVDAVGSSKYIEGLGETLSRNEIFKVLVLDPLLGATEVEWRDHFPYLRWLPNKSFELEIGRIETRRLEVMKTLIEEQQERISSGEGINCYLDWLMSEGKTLTKTQLSMLIWETILIGSDSTLQTAEWAMYKLAEHPKYQDRLFCEIQKVCENNKYTEEQFSEATYLSALFHETLRRYPPTPIGSLRNVHEDTQLGGYDIPAGTLVGVNFYGCNMNKKQWDSPEEWKPERFLEGNHDQKDLYKTMSFGGGKRVCPGALQGRLISCTAIARCIQEFKWSLELGRQEEDITPSHPLLAIITPREQRGSQD